MAGEIEFLCKDFSVEEFLDEIPRLLIKMVAINNIDKDLYIPSLEYDVKLLAIPSKSWASSYHEEGKLEVTKSKPMFVEKKKEEIVEICIPINTQKLERMLNIRYRGDLIGFDVLIKGLAFPCLSADADNISFMGPRIMSEKAKYNLPEQKIDRIVMTSEQFNNIIEKLEHYELLRFEMPVREPRSIGQKDLNEAIKLLYNAKENLIRGDYKDAMLDVRNTLYNHMLQDKINNSQQSPEKVLKQEIIDYVIEMVPSEAKKSYKEIVDHLDVVLRRVRHILSKFIHEGSDKLKLAPLRQDVELCYFLTLFIVRRLSYQ